MRRLISYLLLSLTTLLIIGINLLSVASGLNANLEYSSGREMVFRIIDKANADNEFTDEEAVTAIAETMVDRLESALVTKYDVIVEGFSQVRVTVAENSETQYNRIQQYLSFDAEFTLCTTTEVCATSEQMFKDTTARLEYRGQTPFVVFPVSDLTYLKEVIIVEAGGEAESPTGDLLLWAGKLEEDNYQESLNNPEMAEKIVLRLPVASLWWDETTQEELAYAVPPSKYGSPNENNVFEPTAVAQANEEAIYYRNLFNATALDQKVEFLYSRTIAPAIEPLLALQANLTFASSATLWAWVIATALTLVILLIVYKLAMVGMLASSALSLFATFAIFVWLNLEFSTAALLGLISVGSLGLFTSIIYLTYLRREIYLGRNFKKAHSEANTKLFPFMLDLTVVGLIFGLFTYLFGGNIVRSFSVILMIGSLSNLLLVYLLNQWLYGQLMQAPILKTHPEWIQVNPKLIPNTLLGEKPVYFGRFATRDFASKGSFLTPIAYLAGVISLAAIITLSVFNLPVVQPPVNTTNARIYVEVLDFSQFETTIDVENLLDQVYADDSVLEVIGDVEVQTLTRLEDEIEVDYQIFVASIAQEVMNATLYTFRVNGEIIETNSDLTTLLNDVVFGYYQDERVSLIGYFAATPVINQPTVAEITFAGLLALLMVGIYLLFRGGFAKTFTVIFVSGSLALMTLSLFIASRIPASATLALATLTLTFFSVIFVLVIFKKAQEDREQKPTTALTVDDYTLSLKKASSQSAAPIFLTLLTLLYPGLTYLALGPSALQGLFAAILLGSSLVGLFVTAIIPATFTPLYQIFKGLNQLWTLPNPWIRRKGNLPTPSPVRSNEPQEATYIGIND